MADFMKKMQSMLMDKLVPKEVKEAMGQVGLSDEEYYQMEEQKMAIDENAEILRFTMDKVDDSLIPNKTDVKKLISLADECQNPQSQLIKDTVGKAPLMGKDKWENNIRNSEIIFASVVQCHPQLWEHVTEDITPAAYLMVYSLNPQYSQNIEVLKKVSKKINDFRDMDEEEVKGKYSKDMIDLYYELDDPSSTPHVVLDTTLLQDIGITDEMSDIRIATSYVYDHTSLPNKRLPSDGILPFIRYREKGFGVKVNFSYATKLIPGKYYI